MTTKTKTATKTATKNQAGPAAPKPAKIQTKTEIRNAQAKADKLIRGIDNNNAAIAKHQAQIEKKIAENRQASTAVRSLIAGIGNVALSSPSPQAAKTTAKPAAKAVQKAAAKPSKAQSKPEASAKAVKAMKAKAKAKAKASAAAGGKKSDHKLDEVAKGVIEEFKSKNEGRLPTAAQIYHGCEAFAKKHNFRDEEGNEDCWSRQSLYNQLKNEKRFVRTGEGAAATFDVVTAKVVKTTDQVADDYIKSVQQNEAVASVS